MRPIRTLVLVLAFALTAVACGGDGASGVDNSGTTATTSAVTLPGGDSTLPTVGNIPGLSSGCEAYVNLSLAMSAAFTGSYSALDANIVAGLPPEAQADGTIVVNALAQYSAAIADLGIDFTDPAAMTSMTPAQLQAFSDLTDQIFTDDVQAAFDRLGETMSAECDIAG